MSLFFIASLSAVIFALGSVTREQGLWALPSRGIGSLGLIYVVVQGTFLGTWTEEAATSPGIGSLLIALLGLVLVAGAIRALWRKNLGLEMLITACPLVVGLLIIGVHSGFTSLTASILFNTYIGILALIMLLRGGMTNRIGLVNGCVFTVLAMVGARFFDPAFTFIERGMTFIFAGAVIFVVNAFYMWRKHEEREQINASVGRAGRRLRRKGAGVTNVSGTVAKKRVKASADSATTGDGGNEAISEISHDSSGETSNEALSGAGGENSNAGLNMSGDGTSNTAAHETTSFGGNDASHTSDHGHITVEVPRFGEPFRPSPVGDHQTDAGHGTESRVNHRRGADRNE